MYVDNVGKETKQKKRFVVKILLVGLRGVRAGFQMKNLRTRFITHPVASSVVDIKERSFAPEGFEGWRFYWCNQIGMFILGSG